MILKCSSVVKRITLKINQSQINPVEFHSVEISDNRDTVNRDLRLSEFWGLVVIPYTYDNPFFLAKFYYELIRKISIISLEKEHLC